MVSTSQPEVRVSRGEMGGLAPGHQAQEWGGGALIQERGGRGVTL